MGNQSHQFVKDISESKLRKFFFFHKTGPGTPLWMSVSLQGRRSSRGGSYSSGVNLPSVDFPATEGELSPRPLFSFALQPLTIFTSSHTRHPYAHPSLRAGCVRAGRIDRAASAPGSRRSHTAQPAPLFSKRQNCSSLKIKLTDRYD